MAKGKYQRWIEPEGLILLEGWARRGLTDEQLAHNMNIGVRTLYEWKEKHPQISQALKSGREVADIMVENALFKRAIGYDNEETTIESEEKNGKKHTHIKKVKRHIPGDVTAQIFWLKNRRPDDWRDKRETLIKNTVSQDAIDEVEAFLNGEGLQEAEAVESATE